MKNPLEYQTPRPPWWQFDSGSVLLICINTVVGSLFWVAASQVNDQGFAPMFSAVVATVSGIFGLFTGLAGLFYTYRFSDDRDVSQVRTFLLATTSLIALSPLFPALYGLSVSIMQ